MEVIRLSPDNYVEICIKWIPESGQFEDWSSAFLLSAHLTEKECEWRWTGGACGWALFISNSPFLEKGPRGWEPAPLQSGVPAALSPSRRLENRGVKPARERSHRRVQGGAESCCKESKESRSQTRQDPGSEHPRCYGADFHSRPGVTEDCVPEFSGTLAGRKSSETAQSQRFGRSLSCRLKSHPVESHS